MITLFLCGDVMTGRGIDQILPKPSQPILYEDYVKDATKYVEFAEEKNGAIDRSVNYDYIWGKALPILDSIQPKLRIINLETTVTTSNDWADKSIHYRMSPENISCLTAAKIDCCTLANNHILDWGIEGLKETIQSLKASKIKTVGAGAHLKQAQEPAIFKLQDKSHQPKTDAKTDAKSDSKSDPKTHHTTHHKVIIFSLGSNSSGIPSLWKATSYRSGVDYVEDLSLDYINSFKQRVASIKEKGDIVIVSIHWGPNWGYHILKEEQTFAHMLIDEAGVDIVYGHSSHHFKGLEVYNGKLILYSCGDFINDYEGIMGYEEFRSDLVLMYFPTLNLQNGKLITLQIVPLKIQKFCLDFPSEEEVQWVQTVLNREGKHFNVEFNYSKERDYPSFRLSFKPCYE